MKYLDNIQNYNLIKAIKEGDTQLLIQSIKNGADLNSNINSGADTALTEALKTNNSEIFQTLVQGGADVSKKIGHDGMKEYEKHSLLYYAVSTYNDVPASIIATILENGGYQDVNYAPKGQQTPAEYAIQSKNIVLIKMFEKYVDLKVDRKLFAKVKQELDATKNQKNNRN